MTRDHGGFGDRGSFTYVELSTFKYLFSFGTRSGTGVGV